MFILSYDRTLCHMNIKSSWAHIKNVIKSLETQLKKLYGVDYSRGNHKALYINDNEGLFNRQHTL